MARSWSREWKLRTPALFRVPAVVFILLSIVVAFDPIATRYGRLASYAYALFGLILVGAMLVSFAFKFDDQRP